MKKYLSILVALSFLTSCQPRYDEDGGRIERISLNSKSGKDRHYDDYYSSHPKR